MTIWFKEFSLEEVNRLGKNTMSEFLGIQFIKVGNNYLKATMPVNERTKQPLGLLHGGANVVLAETIASTAANAVIDLQHYYCVGLEINANHLKAVRTGLVIATATPIHLGRTTQVWEITIVDEAGTKTCISRMTAAVITR